MSSYLKFLPSLRHNGIVIRNSENSEFEGVASLKIGCLNLVICF